jgi:hypothetical protein
VTAVTACSYQAGDVNNPFLRKFEWLSYLGGDDIRAACGPAAVDRVRLIYNGNWKEQVRIYELGTKDPSQLDQRVIGPGNLFSIDATDFLAPWRGTTASATLTPAERDRLWQALAASGAYSSPSTTLTLPSDAFYWVVASCRSGAFHLTAWLYPSPRFEHATFPAVLAAFDRTGMAFNPPRPWTEVKAAPLGTAENPARGAHNATRWSVGIAQDKLVDQVVF